MRTIKDLIRYDTDKATEIADLKGDNGAFTLYKTNNGSWFTCHDHSSITALTEHEAALLLEKCAEWKLLEEHFSHLIKDA